MKTQTTGDGSNTVYSDEYQETFHSAHGALAETRHVFASVLAKRIQKGLPTRVLEVGFGASLNFLMTADAFHDQKVSLTYTALEKRPVHASLLHELGYRDLMNHQALFDSLVSMPCLRDSDPPPGLYCHDLTPDLHLRLILGDALEATLEDAAYDAVYLDAFSPKKNPELWTESFLGLLFSALRPGGVLRTYSSQGAFRRHLKAAGFEVTKIPGVQGKREITHAFRPLPRDEA